MVAGARLSGTLAGQLTRPRIEQPTAFRRTAKGPGRGEIAGAPRHQQSLTLTAINVHAHHTGHLAQHRTDIAVWEIMPPTADLVGSGKLSLERLPGMDGSLAWRVAVLRVLRPHSDMLGVTATCHRKSQGQIAMQCGIET